MVGTGRFELEPICGRERALSLSKGAAEARRRNPERSESGVEGSHARAPYTLLFVRATLRRMDIWVLAVGQFTIRP